MTTAPSIAPENAPRLLEGDDILRAMHAEARAETHELSVVRETGSTQADALAASAPTQGCAIFFAEQQTAGQGRRGRPWISPLASNLYFSVSRRFAGPVSGMSGLSLVAGVALCEALHALGFPQVALKWPNDLLADGAKLGGILVNLRGDGAAAAQAVIGVGINVRMPPGPSASIDQAWCDLAGLGSGTPDRVRVAAACLDYLLPALARFEREGLAPFLPRWHEFDALAGRPVRILDGQQVHEGISLGVDASGALRVRMGEDVRSFHSGEVSLRPA